MKIGFVILNYMTVADAVAANKSVLALAPARGVEVFCYVVDNGSPGAVQQELAAATIGVPQTRLLLLQDNLGFARGNNAGIEAATAEGCDFVVCMNNDTLVTGTGSFLERLVEIHGNDPRIALIGPDVTSRNGVSQNPYKVQPMGQSEISWFMRTYTSRLGWVKYWLQMYWIPLFLGGKKQAASAAGRMEPRSAEVYALHGSFLVFTPSFFSLFRGFDPETFLYGEELILAEKVRQAGLKSFFAADLKVFHKEDVSTDASLKGGSKARFFLRHQYDSYRLFANRYLTAR